VEKVTKYVIKRILALIPILLAVSFIIFFILDLVPGDARASEQVPLADEEGLVLTVDDVNDARYETQYALYYAHKELRKLNYLDSKYAELDEVYNKASRAWYKGQYHVELVECGEITQEVEKLQYLNRALNYFHEAKAYAKIVFESLKS